MKKIFYLTDMHCNSCAEKIEKALKERVDNVSVSFIKETAEIEFDPEKISINEIKEIIQEQGYGMKEDSVHQDTNNSENHLPQSTKNNSNNIAWIVTILSFVIILYLVYQSIGGLNFIENMDVRIPELGEQASLLLLFLAGILTGFHCVSMCGAFVLSYTTKNAIKGNKGYKQHLVYGGAKVLSYAIIGGIFGLIGGIFAFSIQLRGMIAIFAGLFMIFYALSMMGIKFFRRFQFNPKFLTKLTHNAHKNTKGVYKLPFITGILSGLFIACGPLQAMYLYAMGTGSFFTGVLSLTAFGLGTLPVMIIFGTMATAISKKATKRILKVSAIIVLVLGLIMLNRGLVVMGSPYSLESIKDTITGTTESATGNIIIKNGYQEINMEVDKYGWTPDSFVLQKDIPVKWNINVKELTGCNNEIIVTI